MTILLAGLLLLTIVSGSGVVLSRDPRRQVFALAVNGTVLAALFFALQAPDVALSELAVGTAATPLLFLATLAADQNESPAAMTPKMAQRAPRASRNLPRPGGMAGGCCPSRFWRANRAIRAGRQSLGAAIAPRVQHGQCRQFRFSRDRHAGRGIYAALRRYRRRGAAARGAR